MKTINTMKKIFTISVICLATFSLQAQNANLANNTEKQSTKNLSKNQNPITSLTEDALSLKEVEYDFGKIPQGKPVTHIFEVVNNSKDSLKIINIQASCGCTTPDWERDKVQIPGGKTKITVGYNAASEGIFTKVITVTYNGTQTKQITIKGEVWKTPTTSAPENKELGNLKEL